MLPHINVAEAKVLNRIRVHWMLQTTGENLQSDLDKQTFLNVNQDGYVARC